MIPSFADFAFEVPFDTGYFAGEPARMAFSVIDFDRARNTRTVALHPFVTPAHHVEDVVPFPFEHCSHGVESILHPALVDDVQRARHIFADTLSLAEWRHAEFE